MRHYLLFGSGAEVSKGVEPFPVAFVARAVARRKGCRLIEEKQLRVLSGRHQVASSPFEAEATNNPAFRAVLVHDIALAVVQAAPIPHNQAMFGNSDDATGGSNAVLEWHDILPMWFARDDRENRTTTWEVGAAIKLVARVRALPCCAQDH